MTTKVRFLYLAQGNCIGTEIATEQLTHPYSASNNIPGTVAAKLPRGQWVNCNAACGVETIRCIEKQFTFVCCAILGCQPDYL